MSYSLRVVYKDPTAGPVVPVDAPVVIGRAPHGDLPLSDEYLSNRHARVYERDGRLFVEDMGSTNGTYVNGQRVYASALHGGDVIGVGRLSVEVLAPVVEVGGYL